VVLKHLTHVMRAKGWHPRHIAGLVRSKYERDHGWGRQWYVYDAATRSDFYIRLFAGLMERGSGSLGLSRYSSVMQAMHVCEETGDTCSCPELATYERKS
jgi:hypothetical protein